MYQRMVFLPVILPSAFLRDEEFLPCFFPMTVFFDPDPEESKEQGKRDPATQRHNSPSVHAVQASTTGN